jgi:hypothetical protein
MPGYITFPFNCSTAACTVDMKDLTLAAQKPRTDVNWHNHNDACQAGMQLDEAAVYTSQPEMMTQLLPVRTATCVPPLVHSMYYCV